MWIDLTNGDNGEHFITEYLDVRTLVSPEHVYDNYSSGDSMFVLSRDPEDPEDPEDAPLTYRFDFSGNKMTIFHNGCDISCSNILSKIIGQVDDPIYYPTQSDSASASYVVSSTYRYSINYITIDSKVWDSFMTYIEHLAKVNEIIIPEGIVNIKDKILMYCFPLLRELYQIDLSLSNIYDLVYRSYSHYSLSTGHTTAMHVDYSEEQGVVPIQFREFSLAQVVKNSCGLTSPKIISLIGKYLIHHHVNKVENHKAPYDTRLGEDYTYEGVKNGYALYRKKTINLRIFSILDTISDLFDDLNYRYEFLLSLDKLLYNQLLTHPEEIWISFFKENFTPRRIINLILNMEQLKNYHIQDTVIQYRKYKYPSSIPHRLKDKYPNGIQIPSDFKTLTELHDKISKQYNEIKAEEENKTIPYTEDEFKIHGYKIDNIELILPSEGRTLIEWGKHFNNCLASYIDGAAKKDTLILGVKVGGELKYAIELNFRNTISINAKAQQESVVSLEIRQFYGKDNQRPKAYGDEEIEETVIESLNYLLVGKRALVPERYVS